MMRTLASVAALLVLASAPLAAGQEIAVEAGTDEELPAQGDVQGVPEAPRFDLPINGLLPPEGAKAETQTTDDAPARPEPASRQSSFAGLSPEARRTAQAATAGAGLALLLGLAAHLLGVPLFSRIQSNHLLDNGVRQRVHDTVVSNPGITIKEITGVCAIGWGTAVYHLKRLETERLIVSERNRQFRRYYKNGGGIVNEAKSAFGELKHPVTERLAQSIVASPGRCQKELCETVGISAPVAHKFLSRLTEAGLVSTQREWKTVKYFPTPKLEDLLLVAKASVPIEAVATATPLAAAA